jgi:hypothetical protein
MHAFLCIETVHGSISLNQRMGRRLYYSQKGLSDPKCQRRLPIHIDLGKLELFVGQFYPVIPNKGHKSPKSYSKRFGFSTLGATNNYMQNSLSSAFLLGLKLTRTLLFLMNVQDQINNYITSQPEPKRTDMQALHRIILELMPACKLWFLDGKNSENKTVSNPNIGYGLHTIRYADGSTREFYQIGLSANTTGISVYILGINDKTYLAKSYEGKIGKASVSGYCIKFKALKDINMDILQAAVRDGIAWH